MQISTTVRNDESKAGELHIGSRKDHDCQDGFRCLAGCVNGCILPLVDQIGDDYQNRRYGQCCRKSICCLGIGATIAFAGIIIVAAHLNNEGEDCTEICNYDELGEAFCHCIL